VITALERGENIRQALATRVNKGVRAHYAFCERERGYMIVKAAARTEAQVPLMTFNSQRLTSSRGRFTTSRNRPKLRESHAA